jgi:hypothetical protein
MTIGNPTKAFLALVGFVCITLLLVLDAISEATGTGMLGTLLGYVVGNSVGSKQGIKADPIVVPKEVHE